MKRGQVSFEFMVIFAFAFFAFLALVSFVPLLVDNADSTKAQIQRYADEIKVKAITASLANSDVKSTVLVPAKINGIVLSVEVFGKPDNLMNLKDSGTDAVLSRIHLPKIDSVTGSGNRVIIEKTNSQMAIILQ
jgi:uncharacterized protein (UPF0333 family)